MKAKGKMVGNAENTYDVQTRIISEIDALVKNIDILQGKENLPECSMINLSRLENIINQMLTANRFARELVKLKFDYQSIEEWLDVNINEIDTYDIDDLIDYKLGLIINEKETWKIEYKNEDRDSYDLFSPMELNSAVAEFLRVAELMCN